MTVHGAGAHTPPPQVLSGLVVVDATRFLSGPYCTMILGDWGADVVKIEHPVNGDDSRAMAPLVNGESYPSAMVNRNKRSIALDLKSPRGHEVAMELVRSADVFVENFRPGVTQRLGLDYDTLKGANPGLVYCSVTGFGQTGPESHRAGFDIIAQGMTGFMRMTGEPGGGPAKFGVAVSDLSAGMTAAHAILSSYIHRLRTGEGQYVDVSLVDAGLALTVWEAGAYFGEGVVPSPEGSRHRHNAPYQAFRTEDGFVTVGANNERLWKRLCVDVLEQPDLLGREEYATNSARVAHVDQLEEELSEIFSQRTTGHWVEALDAAGVPGGPVLTYDQVLEQPQVRAREMILEVDHPRLGTIHMLGMPAKASRSPARVRRPAPLLGQHTTEVLAGAGYDAETVQRLIEEGVAVQGEYPSGKEAR